MWDWRSLHFLLSDVATSAVVSCREILELLLKHLRPTYHAMTSFPYIFKRWRIDAIRTG